MSATEPSEQQMNHSLCIAYYNVVAPVLSICCLLLMTLALYKFNIAKKEQISKNKFIFYLGDALLLSIVCTLILIAAECFARCDNLQLAARLRFPRNQAYIWQYHLLLAFLFSRLHAVFSDSAFALSKRTIIVLCSLFVISLCAGILTAIQFAHAFLGKSIGTVLSAFSGFMVLCLLAVVNGMFISKLVHVFKNVDTAERLFDVVTKTSLLAFISGVSFFVMALSGVASVWVEESDHSRFFNHLLMITDNCTNFWCTLWSFQHFNAWYRKMCCHSKWKLLWNSVVGANDDEKTLQEEMKSTSGSVASV